jgi:hypothetical protein
MLTDILLRLATTARALGLRWTSRRLVDLALAIESR